MDNNIFGERVKELLKQNDMSQRELADRIKVTPVTLSRYITGERTPRMSDVSNIATVLNTTANYLLDTEEISDFDSEYLKIHRLIARNVGKMSPKQKKAIVNALFDDEE